MQIRCTYCQTMFAVGREETLAALESMAENNLKYYDAHCPKCRRANRVERFKLEFSFPGWQAAISDMAKQAAAARTGPGAPAQPVSTAESMKAPALPPASSLPVKKAPLKRHARSALQEQKPASAAGQPARKGKPAAKPAPAQKAGKKAGPAPKNKPAARRAPAKPSLKGKKQAGKKKK